MDLGDGRFATAPSAKELFRRYPDLREAYKNGQHLFQVGQKVELHGSCFKIKALGKRFMRLELLPRKE